MLCPPALIMWWMNELDRKGQLSQGQTIQTSNQGYGNPIQNPTGAYSGPINGPLSSNNGPLVPPSSVFGTSYLKVPFMTPDGTIISQTVTGAPGTASNPNSIVISSPTASQPNIRVFYQDDLMRVSGNGATGPSIYTTGAPGPPLQQPQQVPNSVPAPQGPIAYDMFGRPFQQQLTRVQALQQKEAAEALSALQAATAQLQAQNQANQAGPDGGQQGQGQRGGPRRGGPPYSMIN